MIFYKVIRGFDNGETLLVKGELLTTKDLKNLYKDLSKRYSHKTMKRLVQNEFFTTSIKLHKTAWFFGARKEVK